MQVTARVVVGSAPQAQFVPHVGYNSLLPLALELVPWASPDVATQLALLTDPEQLWSNYGLRSLSKASSMYGRRNNEHNAPYWRGSVWINVNFLLLRSLHACARCASSPGLPAMSVMPGLYCRMNVLGFVCPAAYCQGV